MNVPVLDLQEKIDILLDQAELEHVLLPPDAAQFIASNCSNTKELHGAFARLVFNVCIDDSYRWFHSRDITLRYTQMVLAKYIKSIQKRR